VACWFEGSTSITFFISMSSDQLTAIRTSELQRWCMLMWKAVMCNWHIKTHKRKHLTGNSFIIVFKLFMRFCPPKQGLQVCWVEFKCFCAFFNRLIMFSLITHKSALGSAYNETK
jgi:hypothetical protein